MSLAPGVRLGPYEIVGIIGAGMGEVYRARDTRLGRDVAIKVLLEAFSADSDRRARFEREARIVARSTLRGNIYQSGVRLNLYAPAGVAAKTRSPTYVARGAVARLTARIGRSILRPS